MTRSTSAHFPRRAVLRTVGAASAAAGLAWAAPSVASAASRRVPGELRPGGAFDRFVAEQAAADAFSGTVLLAHRGRPVLSRAYGMAEKGAGLPNRPGTVFSLASVTKCFTGLAVAQLAARGALAFRDRLGTYVGGLPDAIAAVTIHHLLTHTSGVGRPALGGGRPPTWDGVEETVRGTLDIIRATPPQFTPGTRFGYSNDGYWLLGALVTQVSGQSYYDYVRRHVFAPAGMTHTDFLTKPQVLGRTDVARPYWTQPSGERIDFTTTPLLGHIGGPDAGAYSTAPDLLRFAGALHDGTLLDPAYVGLITSAKVPVPPRPGTPSGEREFAAYGFHEFLSGGRSLHGHPGSGPGTATCLDVHADTDWVAIVLGNYDTGVRDIVAEARATITRYA
ncbi:serine hydrolase domain-containing protein [Streptomyces avicenniae]|uniref:serine hydrolase domain-containing protein n=1 Tax=Streptomyces avicenniae TaxID=500153 RepID=UPI00069C068C|nr:serine hydrolase domain-containing protein [Streptomyces avicenniae]